MPDPTLTPDALAVLGVLAKRAGQWRMPHLLAIDAGLSIATTMARLEDLWRMGLAERRAFIHELYYRVTPAGQALAEKEIPK